ncbi:DUF3618 domain-containing protein [Streptomyces sp. 549]|uniref:DUF3618 domain-containing protein n=1 Tax=Streptomyces sp. 549 TaxID=3049076 RepID=UPI0024C29477|nr:DUF3618 domain-containing protein [Streptomyces sp. 549]MDK1473772.1 DUF3618 domain-containing protein [Streptomyces sp. 549]
MAEARTPAQIEAEITRRRHELAATLDELAVRVHPRTMVDDAKARAAAAVDRTAGRAYIAVNRGVTGVRAQFVDADGSPRLERVVPAVVVAVVAVGLLAGAARRGRG